MALLRSIGVGSARGLTTLALPVLLAAPAGVSAGDERAQVLEPVRHDVSAPLRSLTPLAPRGPVTPREHRVRKLPPLPRTRGPLTRDSVRQPTAPRPLGVSATSFEGVGTGLPYSVVSAPSDSTGAAGDTQYVEWVNVAFAVFDKATGRTLYGPADGRTLWSGFGGGCELENDGDPIVLYDRLAKRWLMTQFAVTGGPPYLECLAVSTTSDATGSYARYAYPFEALNDYPKFGVWPDGYYVSFNMFGPSFLGGKACVFEREKRSGSAGAWPGCGWGLGGFTRPEARHPSRRGANELRGARIRQREGV